MRAKMLFIIIISSIFLFLFAGCTPYESAAVIHEYEPQEEPDYESSYNHPEAAPDLDTHETYGLPYSYGLRQPTPPLNIRQMGHDADAALLENFERVLTFTYLQFDTEWYNTLVIWPDVPLRDFSFLSLGFDDNTSQISYHIREVLLTIDEFLPTDVVILNVAFEHYLFPRGGLMFEENGVQRRVFITESMMDGLFRLDFHDEDHWLTWD